VLEAGLIRSPASPAHRLLLRLNQHVSSIRVSVRNDLTASSSPLAKAAEAEKWGKVIRAAHIKAD
jgi:hypothetical protein